MSDMHKRSKLKSRFIYSSSSQKNFSYDNESQKILRDLIIQFVRFVFLQKKIIKQDDELATSSLQEFHKLAIIIEKDTL